MDWGKPGEGVGFPDERQRGRGAETRVSPLGPKGWVGAAKDSAGTPGNRTALSELGPEGLSQGWPGSALGDPAWPAPSPPPQPAHLCLDESSVSKKPRVPRLSRKLAGGVPGNGLEASVGAVGAPQLRPAAEEQSRRLPCRE